MKCRWHPCNHEATHTDPPLCDKHHKARANRLRGPLFIPPPEKETEDD